MLIAHSHDSEIRRFDKITANAGAMLLGPFLQLHMLKVEIVGERRNAKTVLSD